MTLRPSTDFTIVGGGLVGALLALLLARRGYSVVLLEQKKALPPQPAAPLDTRTLALNYGTTQLFKNWGFADLLAEASLISKIHVSDQGHSGIVHMDAANEKLPYLAALLPFEALVFALQTKVMAEPNIHFIEGQLQDLPSDSKIVIGADGANSALRTMLGIAVEEYDYQASALIGKVRVTKQLSDFAFERFTPQGPIALLPVGDCLYTLVWVARDHSHFSLSALQQAFGYRAGIFIEHGVLKSYPLKRSWSKEIYRGHMGLLGNAAHVLHPVAGQGFNLAVRDILTFLEVLDRQQRLDVSLWQEYVKRAQWQQTLMRRVTHTFVKGFEMHNPVVTWGRNFLLSMFEQSDFGRSELNDVMIGRY